MPTDKQRDANKRNAQKSTGPRTDEGKRKSSLNGLRHGLFAKTFTMTPDEENDHARLLESYLDHFRPQDPITLDLVEELAMAKMRQKRCWRIEADLLRIELDRQHEHLEKQFPGEKIEGHMALAYEWLVDESASLVTIRRHEAQLHRAWHKCLNQLERRLPPRNDKLQSEPNLVKPEQPQLPTQVVPTAPAPRITSTAVPPDSCLRSPDSSGRYNPHHEDSANACDDRDHRKRPGNAA